MITFLETLKIKNGPLFYFGLANLLASIVFLLLTRFTSVQVLGVNAWYKPFKFAASICIYSWSMAWYCDYLPNSFGKTLFNWSIIISLGFEIIYIALQAARGQLSHFNISTPTYSALYFMMAGAATFVALYTAYIGILFCKDSFDNLPTYYVWSIRLGIFLFVIFSLEGFVMGSRLTHTIGAPDGTAGLPLVNWSLSHGDARVAHFIGMHALQVLPLVSYYLLRNTAATIVAGVVYGLLALFTLIQALNGKPFHKFF